MGLTFLRHPRPAVPPGICYGRSEVPLGPGAEGEVARCLAVLPPCRAVIASPAERCGPLARAVADRDCVDVQTDPRLLELDFGCWEGRPWSGIPRAESDPWAADPWTVAPPGGETFGALHARVSAVLAEAPDGAVIVSHAGPIRAARMILTGAHFEEVFAVPVPYAEPLSFLRKAA